MNCMQLAVVSRHPIFVHYHSVTLFVHVFVYVSNVPSLCVSQQKQRCPTLEDILVDLILTSMEQMEANQSEEFRERAAQLWQHISAQLIYFVVFYFADFAQLMIKLRTKVGARLGSAGDRRGMTRYGCSEIHAELF